MRERRWIVNHPLTTMAVAVTALVAAACSDNSVTPPSQPEASTSSVFTAEQFDATATPKFTSEGGATPFRTTKTIPYWSSTFTDPTNGVTYPYTMVGTNPFSGNAQTTIPSSIIPFRFVFADGTVMDGSTDVAATIASPIFSNYTYPRKLSGPNEVTQYGDAIYRAQWNKNGTNYHVRLDAPTLYPTQTIEVPANQGFALVNSRGVLLGLMNASWFSSRLQNVINTLGVSPQTIPIVLTHNTMLYVGNPNNCCIIGYHGARSSLNGNGAQAVQTYMFGSFITPNTFSGFDQPRRGLGDIHALSHEVSEWYDDPFVVWYFFARALHGASCGAVLVLRVDKLHDQTIGNRAFFRERFFIEGELCAGWRDDYDFKLVADGLRIETVDDAPDSSVVVGHHYH